MSKLAIGVLAIIGIVALAGVATTVLYSSFARTTIENSGLADYGDDARPITKAEYLSVKVGDPIASLTERFGEPAMIIHGKEIAREEDDVYTWKQAGGGILDAYWFDVDPATKKITAKQLF